ncbi:hypothetical protein JOF53_005421 [Crossiella equi]|uniref:Integral membrane protein n=1 Tax=Crossiella equi TaxID=130796 RepID=A0ABS5AIZ8_9PSEU|nr:hypothetical protein [Crossiella equi]MBP2476549.1 hypothetical protein [Crossiella equi]
MRWWRRQDTRARLILLRNVTMLLVLALGGGASFFYAQMSGAATTASARAVPVLREITNAHTALLRADISAVKAFTNGSVALVGAGDEHRDRLATATSGLTRVAELNQAGPEGIQQIQLVQSLLAAYSSSVEQAASQFRQPGGRALGTADLWQASRLLHEDPGVLPELKKVEAQQRQALDQAVSGGAPSVLTVLLWAVPGALALALLIGGQVWLARHFRRLLNPWLLAATVLVCAALGPTVWVFDSQQRLASAEAELGALDRQWDLNDFALTAKARHGMWDLLGVPCRPRVDCGPTVREFVDNLPVFWRERDESALIRTGEEVADGVSEVDQRWGWVVVPPAAALLAVVLLAVGLQTRIHEYRVGR